MARIRKLEVVNFRSIEKLSWTPSPGVNCLIGPGDSGKSTILEAIDLCLAPRRNLQIFDTDFHKLNVATPIQIAVTLGDLADNLKNIDAYGLFLQGFKSETGALLPEPEVGAETVLTLQLSIRDDLEPVWALVSDRATAQGQSRSLGWADRVRLAPTRLGAFAEQNLGWRRGSLLNRLSEERATASAELAKAAREARKTFGESAKAQVQDTLDIVKQTADNLGIGVGELTAMLDAHSVSFSGGTISVHDADGVPLRGLGLGSTRLLIAGLQRHAAEAASMILIDEVEHGLEPHRIIRLVTSLGAKEAKPPLQVFMTTHSPVAVKELSADQLAVVRRKGTAHDVRPVGTQNDMQATVRACPEAFLANLVIVCEGASEIGFVRGLDLHRTNANTPSLTALGVALADGHGDTTFRRANVFAKLGYRTLILRDNDKAPDPQQATDFAAAGGKVLGWRNSQALEQELFSSLSDAGVQKLLEQGAENLGDELVDAQIKTASSNTLDLAKCRAAATPQSRSALGKAAKSNKTPWFKTITDMELVGREIVGPDLAACEAGFRAIITELFRWASDGGR